MSEVGEFDILILCHKKDKDVLVKNLRYVKKNILGYRKIFLLSPNNFLSKDKNIEFVDEKVFPFKKKDFEDYVLDSRAGWYFQQFLKLYFFRVMRKKVLDNVLILDADTIFLRETKFFDDGKPLYNVEIGYHAPYYSVMKKVFGIERQSLNFSGITHHMVFQRKYVNEIFSVAEKSGDEFWKIIMKNIDKKSISGFSEYDLYFNYMLKFHSDKIKIRRLRFIDFPFYDDKWLKFFRFFGCYYLSAHDYLRRERFPILKGLFLGFLKFAGLKLVLKKFLIKLGLIKIK